MTSEHPLSIEEEQALQELGGVPARTLRGTNFVKIHTMQ
jgi:hypothetical protein